MSDLEQPSNDNEILNGIVAVDDDEDPPLLVEVGGDVGERFVAVPPATATTPLPPCPVTILSGFLGSGKTTLIQYILQSPDHGKRIAVIENEFGEGLQVESLIARDYTKTTDNNNNNNNNNQGELMIMELPNGCVCCTVKDGLVSTLETLLERQKELDYIFIEASGMANPGPIASVFWLDDALESRLQLDGIVTLVDAKNILKQLSTTQEASQQVAYADRILINKIDLLNNKSETTPSLEQVTHALRQLHPTAPMKTTTYSQVPDLDWILNANCFGGIQRVEELDQFWNQVTTITTETSDMEHDHHHDHDHACDQCDGGVDGDSANNATEDHSHQHHRHTEAVSTVALQQKGSLDLTKLNRWLADILWPNQDETDKVLTAMLHNTATNNRNNITKTDANTLPQQQQQGQQPHSKEPPTSKNMEIFRIKGIVSVVVDDETAVENNDVDDDYRKNETEQQQPQQQQELLLDRRRFIVQAVNDLWEVLPAKNDDLQWKENEEREGKLVVIGKYLQHSKLREGFESCFVGTTTAS